MKKLLMLLVLLIPLGLCAQTKTINITSDGTIVNTNWSIMFPGNSSYKQYNLVTIGAVTNFNFNLDIRAYTNNATGLGIMNFLQTTNRTAGRNEPMEIIIWTGNTNLHVGWNPNWRIMGGRAKPTLFPSNTVVIVDLLATTAEESGVRFWVDWEGTNSMGDAEIIAYVDDAIAGVEGGGAATRLMTNGVYVGTETNLNIIFGAGITGVATNFSGTNYLVLSTITNGAAQVVGAGTDYTLTTTMARVDFGTTDPEVTLPVAGTYEIDFDVTFISPANLGDILQTTLRNSTDGVTISTTFPTWTTPTVNAGHYMSLHGSHILTVTAAKTIQIWAINYTGARGTVVSASTGIRYKRLY